MQKETNGDFDLQIRKMMEAAEEPAPAGAWEAISSKLDVLQASASAPSAHSGRRIWYWGGAALAMAASLLFGIFLFTSRDTNPDTLTLKQGNAPVAEYVAPAENVVPAESVEQAESSVLVESVEPVENSVPVKSSVPVEKPVVSSPKAAESAELVESVVPAESVALVESSVPTESVVPAEKPVVSSPKAAESAAPAGSTASAESVAQEEKPDPFALMAYEDSRRRKSSGGFSAVLGGGMSNNNTSSGVLAQAAPGSYSISSITEKSKSDYGIPVTFGAGVRYRLNDVFSVGTGVDYSILVRTFEGTYTNGTPVNSDIRHTVNYIGVPFDVFVHLPKATDLSFYASAGVEAEFGISNKYTIISTGDVVDGDIKGVQWSLGAGLGMEFNLGGRAGLFVEPSARYYYDCGQPKSIRTDKPFQFILRAGLRFDLN